MEKQLSIQEIKEAVHVVAEKYPLIKTVTLFGSYANGNATSKSDVDLMVDFFETPSLLTVCGFQEDLKERLQKSVDIVTIPVSEQFKKEMEIDQSELVYKVEFI